MSSPPTANHAPTSQSLAATLQQRQVEIHHCHALAGDVSARRYFRVEGPDLGSAIVAWYPPELRAAQGRFTTTTELLQGVGVPVPQILLEDADEGWALLEDVGPETLDQTLGTGNDDVRPSAEAVRAGFRRAAELARRIASLDPESVAALNPPLDGAALERELEATWEVFVVPRGLDADRPLAARLRAALAELCATLGEQAVAPCHRDFMVRNLISRPRGPGDALEPFVEVVVLDHQDLRLGPATYDLASLLNDSLFPPAPLHEQLLQEFLPAQAHRADYHRAAAQRTFKAVGTYAKFAQRGNERHLPLIPPTLHRALCHLEALHRFREISRDVRTVWATRLPALLAAAKADPTESIC